MNPFFAYLDLAIVASAALRCSGVTIRFLKLRC